MPAINFDDTRKVTLSNGLLFYSTLALKASD